MGWWCEHISPRRDHHSLDAGGRAGQASSLTHSHTLLHLPFFAPTWFSGTEAVSQSSFSLYAVFNSLLAASSSHTCCSLLHPPPPQVYLWLIDELMHPANNSLITIRLNYSFYCSMDQFRLV